MNSCCEPSHIQRLHSNKRTNLHINTHSHCKQIVASFCSAIRTQLYAQWVPCCNSTRQLKGPESFFCASLVSNSKSALCWATSGLLLLHRINKCVPITEWHKEPKADSDSQDSSKTLFTNSELINKVSTTAVWMWRSGQSGKLTESLQCLACFSQSRWKGTLQSSKSNVN